MMAHRSSGISCFAFPSCPVVMRSNIYPVSILHMPSRSSTTSNPDPCNSDRIALLTQVRRAEVHTQIEVFEWTAMCCGYRYTVPEISFGLRTSRQRQQLLRSARFCRMCGAKQGDNDPFDRQVMIHLTPNTTSIVLKNTSKRLDVTTFTCSTCLEGLKELKLQKPKRADLLAQIRHAPRVNQLDVLIWLAQKFGIELSKSTIP